MACNLHPALEGPPRHAVLRRGRLHLRGRQPRNVAHRAQSSPSQRLGPLRTDAVESAHIAREEGLGRRRRRAPPVRPDALRRAPAPSRGTRAPPARPKPLTPTPLRPRFRARFRFRRRARSWPRFSGSIRRRGRAARRRRPAPRHGRFGRSRPRAPLPSANLRGRSRPASRANRPPPGPDGTRPRRGRCRAPGRS